MDSLIDVYIVIYFYTIYGIYDRAPALFVKTSSSFKSGIKIMGMIIGAGPDCEIIIKGEKEDEREAIGVLTELMEN